MGALSDYFTLAPQNLQVLGTTTVAGAAATTITVSGLDLSAYASLTVFAKLKNATGSATEVHLTYNADTTATNYHSQRTAHTSTTAAVIVNSPYVITLSASAFLDFSGVIMADVDGYPRASLQGIDGVTTGITTRLGSHLWLSNANVTSLTLTSSVASALAIGSSLKVYGVLP